MIYAIPTIRHILQTLPMDKRVRKLVLFGSHAKGVARAESDLDFYLDSDMQITGLAYFDLKGQLEDAFHRPVDLIPDVDVIPGSLIEREIKQTGVAVYGA